MDSLILKTSGNRAEEEKAKRKKKSNKVLPAENEAENDSLQLKTPKKLKPLKPKTNKVAAHPTYVAATAGLVLETEGIGASETPSHTDEDGIANSSNAAPGISIGVLQHEMSDHPVRALSTSHGGWWIPPFGVDNSADVGPDHNIMLVDMHQGRRDAIANRKKNQPQEGMGRLKVAHDGTGKPYSLCVPVLSIARDRHGSLADMARISYTVFLITTSLISILQIKLLFRSCLYFDCRKNN
jgi:hypothetical protein